MIAVFLGDWLESKIAKVTNEGLPMQRECPRIHSSSSPGDIVHYLGNLRFLPKQIIMRLKYTLCTGEASEDKVRGMWRTLEMLGVASHSG